MFEELNPWWLYTNWEKKDKHLIQWNSMKIKWVPRWLDKISLKPFSLNFVLGPRQVGKTTGIKLLIKQLIEKGVEREAIFYLSLDLVSDLKEFREILLKYKRKIAEEEIKNSYIFLDKATKLPGWDRIVKGLIDAGILSNDIVTVTGSSSLYLLKYADSFPGRKGYGKLVIVMPLSFPEFLEIFHIDLRKYSLFEDKINYLFEKYLKTGGFPLSINEISFVDDLFESIEREIFFANKSVKVFKELIVELINTIPSAFSYQSIAQKLSVSHHLVREYLELMEDIFVAKIVYLLENGKVNFRKEKKIFFRDPYIYKTFSLVAGREVKEEVLLEMIVQEHLYRKFGEIYYYKNKYEIDAIANGLKVEVKKARSHRRYPKDVIILSKEEIPKFLIELYSK